MWTSGSTILALTLLVGCATMSRPAPTSRIPFPEAEFAKLSTSGSAVVRGQAFLKTRGGDVKTAAGNEVQLVPVTSYSQQWYEVTFLASKPLTEPDPRYLQYVRRTIADGDGRFTFTKVPPGSYYVVTTVTWQRPSGSRYIGLVTEGGFVVERITLSDGEATDIIVTR